MLRQYIVSPSPLLPVVLVAGGTFGGRPVLRRRVVPARPARHVVALPVPGRRALTALYNAILTPLLFPILRRAAEGSRSHRVIGGAGPRWNDIRAGARLKILGGPRGGDVRGADHEAVVPPGARRRGATRRRPSDNAVRLVTLPAPRGVIRDASGEALVDNRNSLVLTVEPGGGRRGPRGRPVPALAAARRLRPGARRAAGRPRLLRLHPGPRRDRHPRARVLLREGARDDYFPGVDIVELPSATYPLGSAGAHMLGYLGEVSTEKLASTRVRGLPAGRPGRRDRRGGRLRARARRDRRHREVPRELARREPRTDRPQDCRSRATTST